ncbi:MAG: peptide ABC transporter substrate-binding protein [Chloroflexi bacterium RBG_13_51_52]|nr:MAG: peptide ABC transporter substrate-binding protein [Chloroflexi bacterium RBG_13_51_52]
MEAPQNNVLLEVKNLKMYFPITRGLLRKKVGDVKAVDDISFEIKKHETLGLVGESGCGKTTTGRCILRVYNPTSGDIIFNGKDISTLSERRLKEHRRNMGAIFQDPFGSLNPRHSAGGIVSDPLKVHQMAAGKEMNDKVAELFNLVGLDPGMMDRVPHEFSGGQRQRIGVARALACSPSLIICDEPISALDVSIQAQIINLLEELQEKLGLTYLFIAHDLAMVQHISDRVAVMYLGRIMELTGTDELYENPLHPYTKALLSAIPIPDPIAERTRTRIVLKGEVPSPINPPSGCHFHPRCQIAIEDCKVTRPPLRDVGNGHFVACIRV